MVGLNELQGLFQSKQFYIFMIKEGSLFLTKTHSLLKRFLCLTCSNSQIAHFDEFPILSALYQPTTLARISCC